MRRVQAWHRTKKGKIYRLYVQQVSKSKDRKHPAPAYDRDEFYDWVICQKLFHHLFHLWKISNYDKRLAPSVDRMDADLPYSFSNIQLMTWEENMKKGDAENARGLKNGKVINGNSISQFTKKGKYLATYTGITAIHKALGIKSSHIHEVCVGNRKSSNGFIWKYAQLMSER